MRGAAPTSTVEIEGIQGTSRRLRDAAERALDMRPAMLKIRELLIEGHKKQFSSQGAFLGTPWPVNAPETLARKARLGQGATPMVGSGQLRESLEGGDGRFTRVTKGSVRVGTTLFWAIFALKSKHEPTRTPIGVNEAELVEARGLLLEHLLSQELA